MKKLLAAATVAATVPLAIATPAVSATAAPTTHTAAAASSVVSGVPAGHHVTHGLLRDVQKNYHGTTSSNWSGYVQKSRAGSVTSVSASFVVPKTASSPAGVASTWVGIDGWGDNWLIQTGIGEEIYQGKVYYYAWWEVITPTKMLPEQMFKLPIKPGQRVTAAVSVVHGHGRMTVMNNTTGHYATQAYIYRGPRSSTEWIQEDVQINGRISPAPNWHSVSFIHVRRNGANPHLKYSQALDIVDMHRVRETVTSVPSRSGDAFTVRWIRGGSWSNL